MAPDEDRATAREGGIAWLPGFVWAVPVAFAPAVAGYRFEQGDVLHRDRRAYASFVDGVGDGLTAVQLRQPPRSARVVPGEFEGDRRLANWQSEVELELVDLATGAIEACRTTQGRLFTALWKGGDALMRGAGEDPPLPRSARELAQALRDGELALAFPPTRRKGARFAFVVDLSSDASIAKARLVADAITALGRVERIDLDPEAAGARDADRFHPTLIVRVLFVEGAATEAVESALKRVLYGGRSEGERFAVSRHGLLEAWPDADSQEDGAASG